MRYTSNNLENVRNDVLDK